uniref:Uncharacterized protein n=1 Tax=Oryza nivara TaxID=4536 RepID=A0A0E0GZP1_ORYNI
SPIHYTGTQAHSARAAAHTRDYTSETPKAACPRLPPPATKAARPRRPSAASRSHLASFLAKSPSLHRLAGCDDDHELPTASCDFSGTRWQRVAATA